jgi:hypothetical protein
MLLFSFATHKTTDIGSIKNLNQLKLKDKIKKKILNKKLRKKLSIQYDNLR